MRSTVIVTLAITVCFGALGLDADHSVQQSSSNARSGSLVVAAQFLDALKTSDPTVAISVTFPGTKYAARLRESLPIVFDYKVVREAPCTETLDMSVAGPRLSAFYATSEKAEALLSGTGSSRMAEMEKTLQASMMATQAVMTAHPCFGRVLNEAKDGVPLQRISGLKGSVVFEAAQVIVDVDEPGPGNVKATTRQSLWVIRVTATDFESNWFVANLFPRV